MNIWLHRISHHADVSYPLLENGYLSIGFSDFSNNNSIDSVLTDGFNGLNLCFDKIWGYRPKIRYNLWRFLGEMKKGDWVLVPSRGTFSIFEVVDDKPVLMNSIDYTSINDWHGNPLSVKDDGLVYNSANNKIDLGFLRKVKSLRTGISRYEYADSPLTSRMKIRNTNANISNLKESVEKAIKSFDLNSPINIYSQIIKNSVPKILNTIQKELTPAKFEFLVKWYFNRIGATEVYIPPKNKTNKEGDADVIAIFELIKTIIYAQVKFHQGETSHWAIEQITDYKNQKESIDDGYTKIGWVITSAKDFTEKSKALAIETQIHLIDGEEFATLILKSGIDNINNAFSK